MGMNIHPWWRSNIKIKVGETAARRLLALWLARHGPSKTISQEPGVSSQEPGARCKDPGELGSRRRETEIRSQEKGNRSQELEARS